MRFKLRPHTYHDAFFQKIKGIFKFYARKCYLYKNYKRFESIVNSHPQCIEFFNKNIKHTNDILHRKYGCNAFSYDYGYDCLQTTLDVVLAHFEEIFKQSYVLCELGGSFEIAIRSGARMINEGVFTVYGSYDGAVFFDMNFIITKDHDLLITCLQGHHQTSEIFKIFTKEFFGLRPIGFFIYFADILREYLGACRLLGVDDRYQISNFKRGKIRKKREYIITNYNVFWQENCEILSSHKGYHAISPSRKDLEQIPSKKRSMYKKRYEFLDNLTIKDNK